jgi:hypothetical protein
MFSGLLKVTAGLLRAFKVQRYILPLRVGHHMQHFFWLFGHVSHFLMSITLFFGQGWPEIFILQRKDTGKN